jgi:hypothetical protein
VNSRGHGLRSIACSTSGLKINFSSLVQEFPNSYKRAPVTSHELNETKTVKIGISGVRLDLWGLAVQEF